MHRLAASLLTRLGGFGRVECNPGRCLEGGLAPQAPPAQWCGDAQQQRRCAVGRAPRGSLATSPAVRATHSVLNGGRGTGRQDDVGVTDNVQGIAIDANARDGLAVLTLLDGLPLSSLSDRLPDQVA
jgi:hypothetical protein